MSSKTTHSTSENTVQSKVNERFSQTAAGYRVSQVHAQGAEFARLIQAANFTGNEIVLDAGCGAGHTAAHIAPHVRQVIAVDLSEAMLQQAQELCRERGLTNVVFHQGDVESLDLPAVGPIDIITSRFSAHHWPNPGLALQNFRRLFTVNTPGRVYLVDVISLDNFVYDTHLQAIELLRDPSHVRDHSLSQWLAMFQAGGFNAHTLYEWDLPIQFEDWVTRMQTPPTETQAIRTLFAGAPDEVQRRFNLQSDSSFTFCCALIEATTA